MAISPTDFGASFKGFLDQMSAAAPVEEPVFRRRLRDHFECEPNGIPTLSEKFPAHDHANLHAALEAELPSLARWPYVGLGSALYAARPHAPQEAVALDEVMPK